MILIEAKWPDYDTTFTFSVVVNGTTLWDDNGKMPQSLRLLLSNAIINLQHGSTLGETVIEHIEAELEQHETYKCRACGTDLSRHNHIPDCENNEQTT